MRTINWFICKKKEKRTDDPFPFNKVRNFDLPVFVSNEIMPDFVKSYKIINTYFFIKEKKN